MGRVEFSADGKTLLFVFDTNHVAAWQVSNLISPTRFIESVRQKVSGFKWCLTETERSRALLPPMTPAERRECSPDTRAIGSAADAN
jgi:hypothetical protein